MTDPNFDQVFGAYPVRKSESTCKYLPYWPTKFSTFMQYLLNTQTHVPRFFYNLWVMAVSTVILSTIRAEGTILGKACMQIGGDKPQISVQKILSHFFRSFTKINFFRCWGSSGTTGRPVCVSVCLNTSTLILLMWRIGWAHNNARK